MKCFHCNVDMEFRCVINNRGTHQRILWKCPKCGDYKKQRLGLIGHRKIKKKRNR